MEQFSVRLSCLQKRISEEKKIAERLAEIEEDILKVGRGLSFQMKSKHNLQRTIEQLTMDVEGVRSDMRMMSVVLESIQLKYKGTEDKLCGRESDWTKVENWFGSVGGNIVPNAKSSSPDWAKGALSVIGKFGFGGTVISTVGNFIRGDKGEFGTWAKLAKGGYSSTKALKKVNWSDAPWKKVTATSGTKVEWWKKLFGLNKKEIFEGAKELKAAGKLKGLSGAKAGWSEAWKKGKSSVTKSSVVFSAVVSAASNMDEFKDDYMKAETAEEKRNIILRGTAETVVETAVDVGKGVLVTAGVTAVMGAFGIAAAPVAAVAAVGAGICWGADVLCKKFLGDSLTEIVSDGIIDFAVGAANVVSKGAKALWGGVKSLFSFG